MEKKEAFFTHDRDFYKTLFGMLWIVSMQNVVAYCVNMADNIMLGSYSQDALSGAAAVNQIFFMVQMLAGSIGNALVVIASQYWGKKTVWPIRVLTGTAIRTALIFGAAVTVLCSIWPRQLLLIFTSDPAILSEGLIYLNILRWTFMMYMVTNVFYCALRSMGTVNISFYISFMSLIVNVAVNYALIYGSFGFPRMGIAGAAIGTLIARSLELFAIVLVFIRHNTKLKFGIGNIFSTDAEMRKDYFRVLTPVMTSTMLWSVSVPLQTAILGHLKPDTTAADAIAANSVATTFYQTLKVVVNAMASVSGVMIGNSIGKGSLERIRSDARSLSVIDVLLGLVMGGILFLLKDPLLSLYRLSDTAMVLSDHLIVIMCFVMVGMAYQMSVASGIIQGGGDTGFAMKLNLISTWAIVMPLSFMAAFWWKWPVEAVVIAIQSDQFFKGIPVFIRFRSYKWIKKLTH